MQEVQVRSRVRKLRSYMLLSGMAKYICVCVCVCVCIDIYFKKIFNEKKSSNAPIRG